MILSAILYLISCVGFGHALGVCTARDDEMRPLWAIAAIIWFAAAVLNLYAMYNVGR